MIVYPSDFPLQLTSPATTQPSMIHQMEAHQPHRQLGVHLVPSLSPKYQIQLLTNRSNKLKVTLRRNSITAHQAATIFEHYIAPAISYPCTTQSIPTSAIDKLQNIALNLILAELSLASIHLHLWCNIPTIKNWWIWLQETVHWYFSPTNSSANQPNDLTRMDRLCPSSIDEYFPVRIWSSNPLPCPSSQNSTKYNHSYLDHIHSE